MSRNKRDTDLKFFFKIPVFQVLEFALCQGACNLNYSGKIIFNIDYALFYVPLKKCPLILIHQHCLWKAAKVRPILDALKHGWICIAPFLQWHRASGSLVSFEVPSPLNCLPWLAKGCRGLAVKVESLTRRKHQQIWWIALLLKGFFL
jgi:hypothetical protein